MLACVRFCLSAFCECVRVACWTLLTACAYLCDFTCVLLRACWHACVLLVSIRLIPEDWLLLHYSCQALGFGGLVTSWMWEGNFFRPCTSVMTGVCTPCCVLECILAYACTLVYACLLEILFTSCFMFVGMRFVKKNNVFPYQLVHAACYRHCVCRH